jgi:uncharacterized protein (TIGR02996 family)
MSSKSTTTTNPHQARLVASTTEDRPFLNTILANPNDWSSRLVFADCLEERGDPRGELVRLLHWLHLAENVGFPPPPGRREREDRLRELMSRGVSWIGPFVTIGPHMRFALIPPGTFMMGSPPKEEGRRDRETLHAVTHSRAFLLGVYPVTRSQWWGIMRSNPTHFSGKKYPVQGVSYSDCEEFCRKLSTWTERTAGLPRETEWEYACRAGTSTPFNFGVVFDGQQGNFRGAYPLKAKGKRRATMSVTTVGVYRPNAFGLYDLHGNVAEWCEDWADWGEHAQANTHFRILRGGSCRNEHVYHCRAAHRDCQHTNFPTRGTGFRVCIHLD